MSDIKFKVNGSSTSATRFEANARNFKLIVDEPQELGGTDEDANPVEYILAGFAGCINVVGHLVAKELGFKIDKLNIEASGDINPNKFLGLDAKERAGFKNITLELHPETNASAATLLEWFQIVEERCPVNDNLSNTTPIRISINKAYAA